MRQNLEQRTSATQYQAGGWRGGGVRVGVYECEEKEKEWSCSVL